MKSDYLTGTTEISPLEKTTCRPASLESLATSVPTQREYALELPARSSLEVSEETQVEKKSLLRRGLDAYLGIVENVEGVSQSLRSDDAPKTATERARYGARVALDSLSLAMAPFYAVPLEAGGFKVKFRSMYLNSPSLSEMAEEIELDENNNIPTEKDPRVTSIGGFLRKYRVDESPQLVQWGVGLLGSIPGLSFLKTGIKFYGVRGGPAWDRDKIFGSDPVLREKIRVEEESMLGFHYHPDATGDPIQDAWDYFNRRESEKFHGAKQVAKMIPSFPKLFSSG